VFLIRNRDDLYARINYRVEEMFRNGAVEEVQSATNAGATARQAIGFKEIQGYLKGQLSESECIARIQQSTRNYAKRQITWFKRETQFEPINLTIHPDPEYTLLKISEKAGQ
jgi:tRNA dimethylallyltransferase